MVEEVYINILNNIFNKYIEYRGFKIDLEPLIKLEQERKYYYIIIIINQ